MTTQELVEAVKKHATENYEKDGWDYVVECWEDSEIAEVIEEDNLTTVDEAIAAIGRVAGIWNERREEIQAEVF